MHTTVTARKAVLASILLPSLLALLAFTAVAVLADDGDSDRAALMAIYEATGGDDWKNNKNWGSNRPLSRWHGVTVNGEGRVVNLDLRRNRLTGALPAEIGDLSQLQKVNLVGNRLSGPLPAEIGQLWVLTDLQLSANSFSGPIPTVLGNLPELTRLRINSNEFSGPLPFDGSSFFNLQTLRIRSNNLEGCIPDHMQDIPRNDLADTGLENCPEDGDRAALLALYDATVGVDWANTAGWDTGAPLSQWHGVTVNGQGRVTQLNLTGNRLHGPIPSDLAGLTQLSELRLVNNSITGSIPGELAGMPALRVLWLTGNYFTGCIPEGLSDIPDNDLDRLELEDCGEPETPPEPEPEPQGTPGVTVSPSTFTWVDEGGQSSFTVVLNGEPTADVEVELGDGLPTSGAIDLSPMSVSFTPENWNVPQTVTVSAAQDSDTRDNFYLLWPVTQSSDARYSNRLWYDFSVAVRDDDEPEQEPQGTPGVAISPSGTIWVDEGGQTEFTVVLSGEPTADVKVEIEAVSTATVLALSPAFVAFTRENWNVPQTVTVSAAHDSDATDDSYGVTPSTHSDDDRYSNRTWPDFAISVRDDDPEPEPQGTPGVTVSPSTFTWVDEGGQSSFTVVLNGEPTADVEVELGGGVSASGAISLSPASLTFTPENWNITQTVTVSAGQDSDTRDNFYLLWPVTQSSDARYSNRLWYDFSVAVRDDD